MATHSDPQSELFETVSSSSSLAEVTIESMSVGFTRPTKDCESVICCIRVPNCLLHSWRLQVDTTTRDTSYIQLVNDHIRGKAITLDTKCERLETHLRRRACIVVNKASKTKPNRAKQQYLAKSTSFDIRHGETLQASLLLEELEMVNEDIGEWIEQYEGSLETISLLREQLASALTTVTSPTSSVAAASTTTPSVTPSATSSTTSLVTASTTSGALRELTNTGRPLHQVGERQRRRKISELKKSVQYVLSFVDSFGLSVENVTMTNSATGTPLTLSYQSSSSSSVSSSSSNSSSSSPAGCSRSLLSDDTLYPTLYLLDRFGVSDEFYHELAMTHPSIPRSVTFELIIYYCS